MHIHINSVQIGSHLLYFWTCHVGNDVLLSIVITHMIEDHAIVSKTPLYYCRRPVKTVALPSPRRPHVVGPSASWRKRCRSVHPTRWLYCHLVADTGWTDRTTTARSTLGGIPSYQTARGAQSSRRTIRPSATAGFSSGGWVELLYHNGHVSWVATWHPQR